MAFTLPDLPYDFNALEPHIDEQTMRIHHGKHHGAYVTNLNNALKDHADWAGKSLDEVVSNITKVPEAVRTAVRNNGGGHWNHSFFWPSMGPAGVGGGEPKGSLASAIKDQLGGLDAFKDAFTKAAMGRFGSGWAWLCVGANKKLAVCSTPNQDNPLMAGVADITGTPILGLDVWEHAYYLKYQNRRPDYIAAWWSVVNWGTVAERFAKAMG